MILKQQRRGFKQSRDPRVAAVSALEAVCCGQSLNTVLPKALEFTSPADRAFAMELIYGSLREWPRLNGLVQLCIKKPLKRKDIDVLALIILGLYQLSSMRVPQYAAVSETVEAVRKLGKSWAASLVNSLLRRYLRDKISLEAELSTAKQAAMGDWLWQAICSQWPKSSVDIFEAFRQRPPMTLRVNLSRISRDDYLEKLRNSGVLAFPSVTVKSAITLEAPRDINLIPGFSDGLSSVQDESAQLAGWLLAPKAGEVMLDACAAPGGKACHLLELAPEIMLLASDINKERLERIRENTTRLQMNPKIKALNAVHAVNKLGEHQFDAILADVPCSAVGVIRRNPDIKLLRTSSDLGRFAQQQQAILRGLWPVLKPGGRLLYITCSIFREENDDVIATAIKFLPNVNVRTLPSSAGIRTKFGIQRLPAIYGGDGLYFAMLEKA